MNERKLIILLSDKVVHIPRFPDRNAWKSRTNYGFTAIRKSKNPSMGIANASLRKSLATKAQKSCFTKEK